MSPLTSSRLKLLMPVDVLSLLGNFIWKSAPHSLQQCPIGLIGSLQCGIGWQNGFSFSQSCWRSESPLRWHSWHLMELQSSFSINCVLSIFLNNDWPYVVNRKSLNSFNVIKRPSMAMLLNVINGIDWRSTTYELLMGKMISSVSHGIRSSCGIAAVMTFSFPFSYVVCQLLDIIHGVWMTLLNDLTSFFLHFVSRSRKLSDICESKTKPPLLGRINSFIVKLDNLMMS